MTDTYPAPNIPLLTMRQGTTIPQLGFGTYKITDNVVPVVQSALNLGYRHLDCAALYDNEDQVGQAWSTSGVARGELFITSKLRNDKHQPDDARRAFEQSLADLHTDYLDLFLIHWPLPMYYNGDFVSTWKVLEEFLADGRARAIGVSNFEIEHLKKIFEHSDIKPMVNQIEAHPYFGNNKVRAFNRENGILTEAWSPLARGRVANDPTLIQIATEIGGGVTASQVALAWALQRGDIIFPKSTSPKRQEENLGALTVSLSPEQMSRIDHLDEGESGRTGPHPNDMDRMP